MVDVKPKVHPYSALEGLAEKMQRLPAHFRIRSSTSDYANLKGHSHEKMRMLILV